MSEAVTYLLLSYTFLVGIGLAFLVFRYRRNMVKYPLGILAGLCLTVSMLGGLLLFGLYPSGSVLMLLTWPVVFVAASAFSLRTLILGKTETSRLWKVFLVGIVLVLPFGPYAITEVQTLIFRPMLEAATRQALGETGWFDKSEITSMKVLSVCPWHAEVFVITSHPHEGTDRARLGPMGLSGEIIVLKRSNGRWQWSGRWDCVWSDCGSADDNIFPPYVDRAHF